MTNQQAISTAVAIVTALNNDDYESHNRIANQLSAHEFRLVVVALAGLTIGLARRAATHELVTTDQVLQTIAIDLAVGATP